MYGDTWDNRYHFDWPDYAPTTEGDEAVAHIRKSYAGTLTMADFWLGKLLDKMDALDMWKDTTVVLTTDHGHLLGEHGYWAKNYMFDYDKLTHIPLFVCAPGVDPRRSRALTTTMDLMPTFMELHGGNNPLTVQAKSMAHLFAREESHNEALLYGYFGKDMGLTDGRYTYCRQPTDGAPIFNHTANPCNFSDFEKRDVLARAELGVFMPHTYGIPHFRIKSKSRRHHNAPDHNLVYDLEHDPEQQKPIHNPEIESGLASKMKALLNRYHAPECQYERLGF